MPFFINADLEITAGADLGCIRDEFGNQVTEMWVGQKEDGQFFASFEINADSAITSPEPLILQFCDLVESLPASAWKVWESAIRRVIDLGYQTDEEANIGCSSLSTEALLRLSSLGIELAITVYPLDGKLSN